MSKLAKHTVRVVLYYIVMWVAILLLMWMCTSCTTTKYVPIETIRTDTLHHTTIRVDSIKQTDSVYIKEYMRGDTIYKDRFRYSYRDKVKLVHDTIYSTKTDSIQVPYPVEKELTAWQKFKINASEVIIGVAVVAIAIAVILYIILQRRKK